MKRYVLIALLFAGCTSGQKENTGDKDTIAIPLDSVIVGDTTGTAPQNSSPVPQVSNPEPPTNPSTVSPAAGTKTYANARFRNVRVQKTGENSYRVTGEGQIFEANFGWVVEDGHSQLKKGHVMTDAGAPDWGKFAFTFQVEKVRKNSVLTLILFESSAKDGSAQYELPIRLD